MKFRNALVFISGAVITGTLYIVLSESYTLGSLFVGAFLGLAAMLACVILFRGDFLSQFHLKFFPLLWYFAKLLVIIIVSGFKSIMLGFSGQATSVVFDYESTLNSDTLVTLLANSITLTPGTTTVDKSGNNLKVLMLCRKGEEKDIDDVVRLEKMIKKTERNMA